MKQPNTRPTHAPAAPRKPQPEECCNQGCTPCVFDRYEEELEKYRAALAAWRQPKKKSL